MTTTPHTPYLYGVNLKSRLPIISLHNICFTTRLSSPDYVAIREPGTATSHTPIGLIPLEKLRSFDFTTTFISARMFEYFYKGAAIDGGQTLINGYGEKICIPEGTAENILRIRDIELAFEEGRRTHAPEAPSRLSCLWLVENSCVGRATLRKMFGDIPIIDAEILDADSQFAADAGWYDDYTNSLDPKYIKRYWTGEPHPDRNRSKPEILVNGIISFPNADQIEHLKTILKSVIQTHHKSNWTTA